MMMKQYPLTAAQKMHDDWIKKYKTQQVSGVSVVASLKAELDFGLLKKCIQLEYERYGCMRIRFTKRDKNGDVKQYLTEKETRDIPLKDLSGMRMEEADNLMQQWAYETFDGDDIPLCDVVMVKLPDGYNGFFIHMDHRLIDSCGLVVMINDLMQLYTHYKFNTPYPQKLADFEEVLVKDLIVQIMKNGLPKIKSFGMISWMHGGNPFILISRVQMYWKHQESYIGIKHSGLPI